MQEVQSILSEVFSEVSFDVLSKVMEASYMYIQNWFLVFFLLSILVSLLFSSITLISLLDIADI